MTKVSIKFKKMAAMFNEAARLRICESSGSEHYSPDDDLSVLVNSFIESNDDDRDHATTFNDNESDYGHENFYSSAITNGSDDQKKNRLENLINDQDDDDDDIARKKIQETACGVIGERSSHSQSHGFKRRLMSRLRDLGFDAGLCKSRWDKFGRHPAGEYEYVDVNVGGNRLIVEVCLAAEFEIARPTSNYAALLDVFPRVFICKPEEMKQVVSLMCSAMRQSMKEMSLHVPPWRKNGYMQAKWFSPYRRTTNSILTAKTNRPEQGWSFAPKRSIGFEF